MDIELNLENFPERIEEFDQKIRSTIDEVVSWEYSYATQRFSLSTREDFSNEEQEKIKEQIKEEVEKCL